MKMSKALQLLGILGVISLVAGCSSTTEAPQEQAAPVETPKEEPKAEAPEPTQSAQEEAPAEVAAGGSMMDSYEVVKGDNLWNISAKSEVYGNPYEWPLIYKANSDKIKDADLIYPGQKFDINKGASDAEKAAAVNHAKTRGAWSIGAVEESDKAYLAQ